MVETVAAAQVTELELEVIEKAKAQLPDGSAMGEMFASLTDAVRRGSDVVYGGVGTQISPNEAAKILSMSRPHLYKLLHDGAVPYTMVGTHKRLRLEDVLNLQVRQSAARKELAETLAHAARDRENLVADLAQIPEDRRSSLLR